MRKKLVLLFLLFTNFNLFGQVNGVGPSLTTEIPKIIPPTPNAAAIEKFGTIPVYYSTGVPNISYPMWTWKRGKLLFDLGLRYHAGGHKVQDMASIVGLGWSLSGLPRISRTILGLPDDHITQGYLYTAPLPEALTYNYGGGYHYTSPIISDQQNVSPSIAITQYNTSYSSQIKSIVEGGLDGQQDIFSYSIGTTSGRFVFNKEKKIVPLEYTNNKIEPIFSSYYPGNPNGFISAFNITDDQGLIYFFERTEQQNSKTYSTSQSITPAIQADGITGWLLTKILDPNEKDSIVIDYNLRSIDYESSFSQSEDYELEHPDYQCQCTAGGINRYSSESSYAKITGLSCSPSNIVFSDGSSVSFEYNFNRDDFNNDPALTKVVIRNINSEIVKQFQLDYSYFLSGNSSYFPYESLNDYNKRLRLDKVKELSKDGSISKPTLFTYNSTPIPFRNSAAIDFWGYAVNPGRGNYTYVPKIKLDFEEHSVDPNYGWFLDGADRSPDAEYVKAGVLEKITYPTGGYTTFEYECNKAYSEVNYYENELSSNTPEWLQSNFNQSYSLFLSNRTEEGIEFLFKTQEFNARPTPDPNSPQMCFEESQDNQLASFQIYSTDGSFSTTIQDSYIHFLSGLKIVVNLPLNKSYNIKFNYNAGATCAYIYPFKAFATGTYYVQPYDKLAGGLRVKKIVSEDGSGKTLVKEYSYNKVDGHSSATLTEIPNYGYYRTTVDVRTSWPLWTRHIIRTSNPSYTLNYFNGSPLVYTRVIEKEVDGAEIEREYENLAYVLGGYSGRYPYTPGQDFPNLSGLLKKQLIKDNLGQVKSEQIIQYNKPEVYLINDPKHRSLKIGTIATALNYPAKYYVVDQYYKRITRAEEISRTTTTYENGVPLTQTQTNTYDPFRYYLKSSEQTNSKGERTVTELSYPSDYLGNGSVYNWMVQQNILSPIVATSRSKAGVLNGRLTKQVTNYSFWNNGTTALPSTVQRSLWENAPETELTFTDYDEVGNIRQYTAKDGVVTSFVWGYNKQYPVAKIVGKTYSEALQSGIDLAVINNSFTSDAAMRQELNKLRSLGSALVTTYTYKPLVGVTSETDANGKTLYYEYDNFNRLSFIRDYAFNILKKFCYKYDGQPVECNGTLVWENKPLSAQFTKTGCSTTVVTYTVPQGKFTSSISQQDADQQAQNDLTQNGQAYADTQSCAQPVCSTTTCSGVDKKCINGVCQTGTKVCTSTTGTKFNWVTTYHYEWSDGTKSPDYTESSAGCLISFE